MPRESNVPVYQRRNGIDPLPELVRMSEETPFAEVSGSAVLDWIATGPEEVKAVLSDAERFTGKPRPAHTMDGQPFDTGNLLHYDRPDHARLRKMLTPEFTVRRMRRMVPIIEEIVEDRLTVLERAGQPADVLRHFAWPVPGQVVCGLLGIPRDDMADLARMLDIRSTSRAKKQATAVQALDRYLVKIMVQKRGDPGDDLLGMLIREHGDELTDHELAGIATFLVSAAVESTAQMLGLGLLALLLRPDQLALLRERPELMDGAVEELLRYVSVVSTASPRTAVVDVPIAGKVVKAGQAVGCSLIAANRAESPDDPNRLDITRGSIAHVAFGHGAHFCLGASLARMQMRIAFARLLERFPDLRLGVPPEELRFRPFAPQYGVETLPVTW